jgi:riboflavin kinase / FMN adenylyltransferase
MRVIRHLDRVDGRLARVVLTLGNFDGVHLGHRAIVRAVVERARAEGGTAVALTFVPHPVAVLAPERAPVILQPLRDRLRVLREMGIAVTVVQRFTRAFASLTPDAFVRAFLLPHLVLRHVVVGYNVTFGRDRAGSGETLRTLGQELGFGVDVVGPVTVAGEKVSSSRIRRLVLAGDVVGAGRLLGRPFALRGRVVVGDRRGRTLGFPTANLKLPPPGLLPPDGVYAVAVDGPDGTRPGVLNIGVRPTFGGRRRTVEVHLLDFAGDVYGRWLTVGLVERLRGEMAFAGPDALRAQIAADVARARTLLPGAG